MKYHAILLVVPFLMGEMLAYTPPRLAPIAKITVADLMGKKKAAAASAESESRPSTPVSVASAAAPALPVGSSGKAGTLVLRPLRLRLDGRPSTSGADGSLVPRPSFTPPNTLASGLGSPDSVCRKKVGSFKKIGEVIIAGRRFKDERLRKAAEQGGVLVDFPQVDSAAAEDRVEVSADPQATAWLCEGEITRKEIKQEWIALRFKCFDLRARLMAFRNFYTRFMDRAKPNVILKSCDKSMEQVDGCKVDYFSDLGTAQGLLEVNVFYFAARDALNECVALGGRLFMGHAYNPGPIYTTDIPFSEDYRLPTDRLGLWFLHMPSCSVCSEKEGVRVEHTNVMRPCALDYDDVCKRCDRGIFERLLFGYVCDPETGVATLNTAAQIEALKQLRVKLKEAEDALSCIFLERLPVLDRSYSTKCEVGGVL